MPGAGMSTARPFSWYVIMRPILDFVRRCMGWWTTQQWHDWMKKCADEYGLYEECFDYWASHLEAGYHPSIAARWALDEWDL